MSRRPNTPPPDGLERQRALDPQRSILVRAPAGSGKTDLLTRRFLLLLSQVNDPGEIVAITFTKAAAAEMRHRIIQELENAAAGQSDEEELEASSMRFLARRAFARSQELEWNLIELPAQLRVLTIDSFCREIALQEPILSGLGGGLTIHEHPRDLYRRAARRTLQQIGRGSAALNAALETLLLWRDNSWSDLEDQIVTMLSGRDQWMHEEFLDRDQDWKALRELLERSFVREVRRLLTGLELLFEQTPGTLEEAHRLAQFACAQRGGTQYRTLAELAVIPHTPDASVDQLDVAQSAYRDLAELLLTGGHFRQRVDKRQGFPAGAKEEKARLTALISSLSREPAFEEALAGVSKLPSAHYADEEWEIVRACFTVLRHAAGELRVVFAETSKADFTEIAQIAQRALKGPDNLPTDAAQAFAERIRHLLVDEFQDTSRRQHQLLTHLVAAWSGREERTCFFVGDPMQSIYFFRDADAELFRRVEQIGLEVPEDQPLVLDPVQLFANFRSAPDLVERLNCAFAPIFAADDGSDITFTPARAARGADSAASLPLAESPSPRVLLHSSFMPASRGVSQEVNEEQKKALKAQRDAALDEEMSGIVALIRSHEERMNRARATGKEYRIAILGRARRALEPVAQALRKAAIPFNGVELEPLRNRPEIVDAMALTRALVNPVDRVGWLGVLRAPWCGLSLTDLHTLTSADNEKLKSSSIQDLLAERAELLSEAGQIAVRRVERAIRFARRLRATQPAIATGTWIEQVWLELGGAQCVDASARANLDLLWRCLDGLPQGEPDLMGSALDAALADLMALPDPAAEVRCGVQLMTIHKAKGLEFEVVIVPELQAKANRTEPKMLSWLERGLPPEACADGSSEITEFLVAPFPSKGADRSSIKAWVDRQRYMRERQESRRILYVAATRAREELHLFSRLEYKTGKEGQFELAEPGESLLFTAWPGICTEGQQQFEDWKAAAADQSDTPQIVEALAASADNVVAMPTPIDRSAHKPTILRRLPPDYRQEDTESPSSTVEPLSGSGQLYARHEGGIISRALGKAVHELFELLAQLLTTQTEAAAHTSLARFAPRMAANLRAAGIGAADAARLAEEALAIVLRAGGDPQAQWILGPHPDAANEARWTGVIAGKLRTVRVDRVFRSGAAPLITDAGNTWWIVDYKTAQEENPEIALPDLRRLFAPQIEAYAKVLRNLNGHDTAICGALYYPRMTLLDWWKL